MGKVSKRIAARSGNVYRKLVPGRLKSAGEKRAAFEKLSKKQRKEILSDLANETDRVQASTALSLMQFGIRDDIDPVRDQTKLSIAEMNFTYWQISSMVFRGIGDRGCLRGYCKKISGLIADRIRKNVTISHCDDIVIFTAQFLGISHGPTRRALDYATALEKALGIPCRIVNLRALPEDDQRIIEHPFVAARSPHPNGTSLVEYHGLRSQFCQVDLFSKTDEEIFRGLETLEFSRTANVALSVPFAVDHLDGDELRLFHLASSYDTPVFNSGIALSGSEEIPEAGICKIEIPYNTDGLRITSTTRTITDFVRVAIVGTRLDNEVSTEDMEVLVALADLTGKEVEVSFIGSHPGDVVLQHSNRIKVVRVGHIEQQRMIDMLGEMHFYYNPHRLGGGSSAAQAMATGLPVVSGPYGDVYGALGYQNGHQTAADKIEYMRRCVSESEFYRAEQDKALTRFAAISTPQTIVEAIKKNLVA